MSKLKTIKGSKRGITFCAETANIGAKYRYIVDMKNQTVNIIMGEGENTVSRKKSGNKVKPLFDLRSKEVKKLINNSAYMEIEELADSIVVHVYKKTTVSNIRIFKHKTCSISEVLGTEAGQIIIPKTQFKTAAGMEYSAVASTYPDLWDDAYFEYISNRIPKYMQKPKKTEIKAVYDVVSLFSGAGLFDRAWLDNGRFRFVYANDFCEDVIETYRHNIGNHITCKDIRDVTAEEIPFADVFSASPCCQAFSNANRKNIDSKEGEVKRLLVDEVVRLTKEKKPKVIVIENVPEFLTKSDGLYIGQVLEGLPEYEFSVQLIEDHKVGGYSYRKRAIVIGSRIGKIEVPQLDLQPYKTVRDALSKVDAEWYNYNDITKPRPETLEKMKYVPQGGNWQDIPKEVYEYGPSTQSCVMKRLSWDEPSITICNFRKNNIMHPEKSRILSVSEASAIMGLDKSFRFISDSLNAKQQMVANGVTQAIGKIVAKCVEKALDKNCSVAIP